MVRRTLDALLPEPLACVREQRQRAYRERKAAEVARLRGSASKRKVSARLVKVLGMLGSDQAGERDNAARMASQILKDAGLTWYDVLDVEEDKKK